ncbi:MAG: hypothetical protein RIR70_2199 [Pseudomonadota bacterium]
MLPEPGCLIAPPHPLQVTIMPFQPFSMAAAFSPGRRAFLATLLVLAAIVVPWMSPVHPAPLADWVTDALTVTFIGLAAMVPLAWREEKNLTRAMIFGLAMVVLLAVLHLVHRPLYLGQTLVPVGALLAMVLLATTVRNLSSTREARERFLDCLAVALLFSALVQALIGFLQYTGLANHFGMWMVHTPGAATSTVMGNISQRNVFAHMLALGTVAACWLHARGYLRLWMVVPIAAFIGLIQAWCGARLVLAYGGGLIVLALVWWLRARQDESVRRFCKAAWITGALVLGMQWGGTWVAHALWTHFGVGASPESGFGRLFELAPTQRRWSEWSKALDAFAHHPFFGVGWGGLAYNSAYTEAFGPYLKIADNTLCLHAHNLVVQMLAETGLVGALLAVGGIAWCLWPNLKRPTVDSVFLLGLAMMTLAHSQFEYPLWYVTGLATFTIVLAASAPEPVAASIVKPIVRRFGVVMMSAILLIHAITGWSSFRAVAVAFSSPPNNWSKPLGDKLYTLQNHPIWAFESELIIALQLIPVGEPLKAKRDILERQASYRPYGPILFKLAMMRAIDGDLPGAMAATDMLIAGFPGLLEPFLAYADQFPEAAIEPIKKRMEEALLAEQAKAAAATSTVPALSGTSQ